MSASLVGSEMCIRDSCCAPSGSWSPGEIDHVEPPGRIAGKPQAVVVAVSYTHLTLPTICSV
eukprot:13426497-Alexandrium_andersonii.AAC.1